MERMTDKAVLSVLCCVLALVGRTPSSLDVALLLVVPGLCFALELPQTSAALGTLPCPAHPLPTCMLPQPLARTLPLLSYELAREPGAWRKVAWLVPATATFGRHVTSVVVHVSASVRISLPVSQ